MYRRVVQVGRISRDKSNTSSPHKSRFWTFSLLLAHLVWFGSSHSACIFVAAHHEHVNRTLTEWSKTRNFVKGNSKKMWNARTSHIPCTHQNHQKIIIDGDIYAANNKWSSLINRDMLRVIMVLRGYFGKKIWEPEIAFIYFWPQILKFSVDEIIITSKRFGSTVDGRWSVPKLLFYGWVASTKTSPYPFFGMKSDVWR